MSKKSIQTTEQVPKNIEEAPKENGDKKTNQLKDK